MPNTAESRLDRSEAIIEALATGQADIEDEFRRLLRAQVVMADSIRELAAETTRRFAATDDKLNALIDIVRKRPPLP